MTTELCRDSRVAKEVFNAIERSQLNQTQIAKRMGLGNSNMLSIVKSGRSKLPASMLIPFCEATDTNPSLLTRLFIKEYLSELEPVIDVIIKSGLSEDEALVVEAYREADNPIQWMDENAKAALVDVFSRMD